ncbi:MAG: hypothetical protein JW797_16645 [Bradymonadales bacterium]|nr:hypothetical protein [Bradymonadales bacterium]
MDRPPDQVGDLARDRPADPDQPVDRPPDRDLSSDGDTPDRADIGDDTGPSLPCLEVLNAETFYLVEVGETLVVQACLANCGTYPITVSDIAVSSDSPAISALLASEVQTPIEVPVGDDCVGMPIVIQGLQSGWGNASAVFSYSSPSFSRIFTLTWSTMMQVEGSCPVASVWAQPDRGASGGSAYLTLDIGHQIAIELMGDASYWIESLTFLDAPTGSLQLLQRRADRRGIFVPDMIGRYGISLLATDGLGCNFEHTLTVDVTLPLDQFVAWVVWPERVGADAVNDLDFYVARQTSDGYYWQTAGQVVGPNFSTANFGDENSSQDDPHHHFDYNTQGFGPELITIATPSEDEQLAIGVHAFSTETRWRPANPRIQIYLAYEQVLDAQLQLYRDHFWLAAETLGTELTESYTIVVQGFPPPNIP